MKKCTLQNIPWFFVLTLNTLNGNTKVAGDVLAYLYPIKTNLTQEFRYMNRVMVQNLKTQIKLQKNIYIAKEKMFKKIHLQKQESESFQNFVSRNKKNQRIKGFHIGLITSKNKNRFSMKIIITNSSIRVFQKNYSFSKNTFSYTLKKFGEDVRKFLCSDKCATLSALSNPKGASVYIDKFYLGKSPLKIKYLNPNSYEVEFLKNGFERQTQKIILAARKGRMLQVSLSKEKGRGGLSIETTPPKASVYFNVEYHGESPLKIQNLTEGTYKLKIKKEGFYEEEKTIAIENQKETKIKLELISKVQERPPPNKFWGILTYEHVYIGSFVTSIASFATAIYFSVEASRTRENTLVRLGGRSADSYTQTDLDLISESRRQSASQQNVAIALYATGGALLGLSLYFFLTNLRLQDAYSTKKYFTFWISPAYDSLKKSNSFECYFYYSYPLK